MSYQFDGAGTEPWFVTVQLTSIVPPASTMAGAVALEMMVRLLVYCYANGIFSSRRIERATHRDIGVRLVAANQHPDHDTIATFRRRNFQAVAESFLQVLLLACGCCRWGSSASTAARSTPMPASTAR